MTPLPPNSEHSALQNSNRGTQPLDRHVRFSSRAINTALPSRGHPQSRHRRLLAPVKYPSSRALNRNSRARFPNASDITKLLPETHASRLSRNSTFPRISLTFVRRSSSSPLPLSLAHTYMQRLLTESCYQGIQASEVIARLFFSDIISALGYKNKKVGCFCWFSTSLSFVFLFSCSFFRYNPCGVDFHLLYCLSLFTFPFPRHHHHHHHYTTFIFRTDCFMSLVRERLTRKSSTIYINDEINFADIIPCRFASSNVSWCQNELSCIGKEREKEKKTKAKFKRVFVYSMNWGGEQTYLQVCIYVWYSRKGQTLIFSRLREKPQPFFYLFALCLYICFCFCFSWINFIQLSNLQLRHAKQSKPTAKHTKAKPHQARRLISKSQIQTHELLLAIAT